MIAEETFVLDEEFCDHLTLPASSLYLYKERFSADLFLPDEKLAAQLWGYVVDYILQYKDAPDHGILQEEFPQYDFHEPKYPIQFILKKFRERYAKNQIKISLKRVARSLDNPLEARTLAYREFQEIAHKTQGRASSLDTEDWDTYLSEYRDDVLAGRFQGVTFGWDEVNQVLGGLRKGGLYYNIGRPKRFKSWLILQSAVAAQFANEKVMFYSLELPQKEMFGRYMCLTSEISWQRFQHGQLLKEDYAQLGIMKEFLAKFPTLIIERPDVGVRTVVDLCNRAREEEASAIYIDQMGFIEDTRAPKGAPIWERVKYICEDLKNAAVSLDIPIYVAAQFNRLADNPNLQEMGDLSMIAGGDAIGQYADMLFGVYQDKAMRASKCLEFGTIESRSFEHARWEMAVELTTSTKFRILGRVTE